MRTPLGRADLARVLDTDPTKTDARAALIGFERVPTIEEVDGPIVKVDPPPEGEPVVELRPLDDVAFLIPRQIAQRHDETRAQAQRQVVADGDDRPKPVVWSNSPDRPPKRIPIGSEQSAAMRLERLLGEHAHLGRPDISDAVKRISEGEILERLSRNRKRVAPARLCVLFDVQSHTAPFRRDFASVLRALREFLPTTTFEVHAVSASQGGFLSGALVDRYADQSAPVLAMTDFGGLGKPFWARLGRRLARSGTQALALAPSRTPDVLAHSRYWTPVYLSDDAPSQWDQRIVDRLLILLAHADQIPPDLVRGMRVEFFPGTSPRIEALFWSRREIKEPHPSGATLDEAIVPSLQNAFAALPLEDRKRADAILRAYKAGYPDEVRFKEVASYGDAAAEIVPPADLAETSAFFEDVAARLSAGAGHEIPGIEAWLSEFAHSHRNCERMWSNTHLAQSVSKLSGAIAADPKDLDGAYAGPLTIAARGHSLLVGAGTGCDGSMVAILPTGNGHVEQIDTGWADRTGQDDYGHWAEIEIDGVVQRLRWIPPGRFLIGSPESEPGRRGTTKAHSKRSSSNRGSGCSIPQ